MYFMLNLLIVILTLRYFTKQFLRNLLKKGETIKMIGVMCEQYETDRDKCAAQSSNAERNSGTIEQQDDKILKEVNMLLIYI